MFQSPLVLLVLAEIAFALLLLCVFLLLHVRSLRRLVAALEERVISVRETLKNTRQDFKAVQERLLEREQTPALSYSEHIESQLAATRNHHLSLDPDRDIVLDIEPDTTMERQVAALRHAFLVAEQEAALAADNAGVDWEVLQAKLARIIDFYQRGESAVAHGPLEPIDLDHLDALTAPPAEADASEVAALREQIDNQTRQIENLEKFRKLFFDTEEKWRAATAQADQYKQELLHRSAGMEGGDDIRELLARYSETYADFGAGLADERGQARAANHVIEVGGQEMSVGKTVIANQEEILRLRNMAIDQHRMIISLRQQLESAESLEQKAAVIAELHKQLERHERFLKESDICARQIEEELERTLARNHELEQQLLAVQEGVDSDSRQLREELARTIVQKEALEQQLIELTRQAGGAPADEDLEQLKKIVEEFTHQSCEMLESIEKLEEEARELRGQLEAGSGASSQEAALLQEQLAEAERELLALQAQHVELEERYLELKVQQV